MTVPSPFLINLTLNWNTLKTASAAWRTHGSKRRLTSVKLRLPRIAAVAAICPVVIAATRMRAATAATTPVPISLLKRSGGVREVLLGKDDIPLRPGTDEVYVPHLRKVIHDQLKQEDATSAPWHWSCVNLDRVVSSAEGEDAVLESNPLTIKFRELIPAVEAPDISQNLLGKARRDKTFKCQDAMDVDGGEGSRHGSGRLQFEFSDTISGPSNSPALKEPWETKPLAQYMLSGAPSYFQDCLSLGEIENLKLECRGTFMNNYAKGQWTDKWPAERQKKFFGFLAANSKRPNPCALLFTAVKRFAIFLHAFEDGADAHEHFNEDAIQNGLGEFFRHAPQLEELEIYWNGKTGQTLEASLWQPLAQNDHAAATLKKLFVVGGNLRGIGGALVKLRALQDLVVVDAESKETLRAPRWGVQIDGLASKSPDADAQPLIDEGLDEIREYLKTDSSRALSTLTLTPAVLARMRDGIAESTAPIQRFRIWGVHDVDVFQQAVEDLKFILLNKPDAQGIDLWFMVDQNLVLYVELMHAFFTERNIPLLQKLGVVRFSFPADDELNKLQTDWLDTYKTLEPFVEFFREHADLPFRLDLQDDEDYKRQYLAQVDPILAQNQPRSARLCMISHTYTNIFSGKKESLYNDAWLLLLHGLAAGIHVSVPSIMLMMIS
ncbi:unnamed protein product [Amoebophrya sp. A120]|nr:unnamed protein product [Amoebophrya sp. A120]|eukprot:GSA120T00014651001.1